MMTVIVHVHFKWRVKCISLVVTLDLMLNEIILLLHLLWILVDYQIFQLGFHSEDVLLMARDPRTTRCVPIGSNSSKIFKILLVLVRSEISQIFVVLVEFWAGFSP